MRLGQLVGGLQRRVPPVGGVLLGPARMRTDGFDRFGMGFAQRVAIAIDQQGLDAGSADIDAEIGHEARTSRLLVVMGNAILPTGSAPAKRPIISGFPRAE